MRLQGLLVFLVIAVGCVNTDDPVGPPPAGDDDDTWFDDDDTAGADDDDAAGDDDDDAAGDDDDAADDDDATPPDFEGDEPGECSDGADNDADGFFDCDDTDCFGAPVCAGDDDDDGGDDDDAAGDDDDGGDFEGDEPGECADGADNDLDGFFDCNDSDCFGAPDCAGDDDDAAGDDDDAAGDDDDAAPTGCEDPANDWLVECAGDDAFEPNDTQSTATDLTWDGGGTWDLILCEGSDDWFEVCLGEGGSYEAVITDYDNPDYLPPETDVDVFNGSTPTGFTMSVHAFGLERSSPAGTCHWYTLELTVTNPTACL